MRTMVSDKIDFKAKKNCYQRHGETFYNDNWVTLLERYKSYKLMHT